MEEDLYRTKNTLQSRIKDREEEIQKLRNQVGISVHNLGEDSMVKLHFLKGTVSLFPVFSPEFSCCNSEIIYFQPDSQFSSNAV